MRQSGDYAQADPPTLEHLRELLWHAIDELDVDQTRAEVAPFVRDRRALDVWSPGFLRDVVGRIIGV